jgi:glycosyltransferase involved in cell wall biosynthesis
MTGTSGQDRPLRVLHVTVSDTGGAGVACMRLHRALQQLQVDSRVMVRRQSAGGNGVLTTGGRREAAVRSRLDALPLLRYRNRKVFAWWSTNWMAGSLQTTVGDWTPDLLHIHWIGDGFVSPRWLSTQPLPTVWTMHDMWPFTGGCHYAGTCTRYQTGCGACPQLGSSSKNDLSLRSARLKRSAWQSSSLTFVSPSPWLARTALESSALRECRVEVIPNGLDGNLFKPGDRSEARKKLGLPQTDRILLSGVLGSVDDERKGFTLLTAALQAAAKSNVARDWRLVVFGADSGPGEETLGIPVSYCGMISKQEDLPALYRAADLFVLPSLQDNLPNTIVESLACGTPVAGFRSGGIAGMIEDGRTGWLAEPFSIDSLAVSIRKTLECASRETLERSCRNEFELVYAWPGPAERYIRLYRDLLAARSRR